MKKLIINADDFGLHPLINQAIMQGHRQGCITSTSLMPTGAAFEDAVALSFQTPTLGVGVHLTLVAEKPLLDLSKVKTLVAQNGQFPQEHTAFIRKLMLGQINLNEVYLELSAQIERVVHTGLMITHLDSHQHLHVLPGIIDVVLHLAEKFKIEALRIPAEPYFFTGGYKADLKRTFGKWGLTFFARNARKKAKKKRLTVPDYFFGMLAGGHLSRPYLANIIHCLPEGSSEIMIHPGLHSEILEEAFRWNYNWEKELAAVLDKDILNTLQEKNINLTSFGAL